MIKYGAGVNLTGFSPANLFALDAIQQVTEEQTGRTTLVTVLDVGPLVGITADLRQTGRVKAIASALQAHLEPLGYTVKLEGDILFVSPELY